MMIFAQLGLGLLANLVSSGANRSNNEAAQRQLQQTLNETNQAAMRDVFGPQQNPVGLEDEAPPFPNDAADRLNQKQQTNADQRQTFLQETKSELEEFKTGFFEDHHLETEKSPDGKERVALNQETGRPTVQAGKENPEQKVARESFERTGKETLKQEQTTQRETLVRDEKQQLTTFLQNHKPDLGNPAVQSELQKMIMLSHKKALALSRKQEEEDLKFDLYSSEQVAHADGKIAKLRQMEERHAAEEDSSPEAGELLNHQQDLAELLRQKREEAKQVALEESFLRGKPRFETLSGDNEVDLATVLPPYLSNALYNMGIYSV